MPKKGWLDPTYTNKLTDIGIRLLEPFKGAKKHHLLQCIECNHEWSATPLSKLQNHKKYGVIGCPKCTFHRRDEKYYLPKRTEYLQKIKDRGFEILTDFDGRQNLSNKFTVRNLNCGHEFEADPKNIIARNVNCPICNNQRKRKAFQQFNTVRQVEYQKTASEWDIFRHEVYQLTRQTYKEHHSTINPNNLMRGRAGVDGAYHLDHLVPVRYCFDNGIPSTLCAHHTNLQMLHWNDNVGSRDKLKENVPIPPLLQKFTHT